MLRFVLITVSILTLYISSVQVKEVHRTAVLQKGSFFLSIDSFYNPKSASTFCTQRNSACSDIKCGRCTCRNFDTFISKDHGCKAKNESDGIINKATTCFYAKGYQHTYPTVLENVTESQPIELFHTLYNSQSSGNRQCYAKNISYINNKTEKKLLWLNSNQTKIKIWSENGGGKYHIKWNLTKEEIRCMAGMLVSFGIDCHYPSIINHKCFMFKVAGIFDLTGHKKTCILPITTTISPITHVVTPSTMSSTSTQMPTNKSPTTKSVSKPTEEPGAGTHAPSTQSEGSTNTLIIVGAVGGVVVFILVLVLCFAWRRKKKQLVRNTEVMFGMDPIEPKVVQGEIYAEVDQQEKVPQNNDAAGTYEYAAFKNEKGTSADNIYALAEDRDATHTNVSAPHGDVNTTSSNMYEDTESLGTHTEAAKSQNKSAVNIYYDANATEAPALAAQLYEESSFDKDQKQVTGNEDNSEGNIHFTLEHEEQISPKSVEKDTVIANPIYE